MHVVSNLGVQGEFTVDNPIIASSNIKGKQENKAQTTANK